MSTAERASTAAERAEVAEANENAELARLARDLLYHIGPWSAEEFLELPDWTPRVELVDGVLLISSHPGGEHHRVMRNLTNLLDAAAPDDLEALFMLNLQLGPSTVLGPDVLLFTRGMSKKVYQADDVALVAEVEAPDSPDIDRILRPHADATAGIPWFMRVGLDGPNAPEVFVYRLEGGEYVEHARAQAGQTSDLTEPVNLSFDPAILLRR